MKKRGQIVLESALVLISMTVLLVLVARTWIWFGRQFGQRWSAYNGGRLTAGKLDTYKGGGYVPIGYSRNNLEIFR